MHSNIKSIYSTWERKKRLLGGKVITDKVYLLIITLYIVDVETYYIIEMHVFWSFLFMTNG